MVSFSTTFLTESLPSTNKNIMIDPLGIQQDDSHSDVWLCNTCHPSIMLGKRPPESLANFRWVGPTPDELKNLTWIEELLIARAHVVGRVVRLQARNQASHFVVKAHVTLLPQDTTLRLDILPMTPASLPDVVRVVWTGKSAPERDRIRSQFTVRRETVYNADHGRRAYLKQFALTLACAPTDYKP